MSRCSASTPLTANSVQVLSTSSTAVANARWSLVFAILLAERSGRMELLCSELNRSVCSTSHHSVGFRAQIIRSAPTSKFARFAMLHEQAPHHGIARTT